MTRFVGRKFRFDYPQAFTSLPDYSAHRGQEVTVLRRLKRVEEYDYQGELMFEVRAADGWKGHAFESELMTRAQS